jgi:iron complex outermembrane receptor protein
MDRVEVLRGPQGTLFGRNATGGLIHFIAKRPTEQDWNGYVEGSVSGFGTSSVEGAIGGALSERVRVRFAAREEQSDGYVKAGTAFDTPAEGQTSHGANGFGLRAMMQVDASDDVKLDLTLAYSKDDDVPSGQYVVSLLGFDPVTGLARFTDAYNGDPAEPDGPTNYSREPITSDVHRHWSNEDTSFDRESTAITAQVTADLGAVELVSITNWLQLDKNYLEDAAGGLGFFPYNTVVDYQQISQELRLTGSTDRWRWQLGAYYLDMEWDTSQRVEGSLILFPFFQSPSDTQQLSTFGLIDSKNWSVFGEAEFDLTDRLTVIGGLRWSQDDKQLSMRRIYSDVPEGIAPIETFNIDDVATRVPGVRDIDYGDVAARLQLNLKANDDNLIYASYNRGIKGGNWSLDPLGGVLETALKHGEEVLNSFELGWKSEFLNGTARLNAAAFYYDYEDYQAFSLLALTPQVTNSDAEASGAEIELTLAPTDGLDLMLGVAALDSTVDAVPDVFGGTLETEFPLAPAVSLNFLARYEWPALGGKLAAQIDGNWNDDHYLEGTNSEASFEKAYAVMNASLSYALADDKLRIGVFARNFTDEEYRVYNLDLGLLGFVEQVYAPPRRFGVSVSYHW